MVYMSDFSWQTVVDFLNQNNIPEAVLALVGVIAIAIVFAYRANDEGFLYRLLVLIGVVAGAFMVYTAVAIDTGWFMGTLIIVTIASFALIIRPFRDVNFALIFSLLVMALVYIALGGITGDLSVLATGWPRIIIAFAVGAILYMLTGFIQDIIGLFAKLLNAWPLLFVIGVWCIAEAVMLIMGYGSVIDYIQTQLA